MAKSARQLYNRALEILNVLAAGQTAEAEDWAHMRLALEPLLDELRAIEVCNVKIHPTDETSADIPDAYFNALALVLANEVAPAYGVATASGADRDALIQRLRVVTADGPHYWPAQVEYF